MKKTFLFLLLIFTTISVSAQEKDVLLDEYNAIRKKSIDTTVSKEEFKLLSNQYLTKVKKIKDKKYIGRAFYLQALGATKVKEKITYLDSAVIYTEQLDDDQKFPMRAYMYKSKILFNEKDYKGALDALILGEHAATKSNNLLFRRSIKYNIGMLNRFLGENEEAEKLFLECKTFEESRDQKHIPTYISILQQLSSVYLELEKIEECTEINKQGIKLSKENNSDAFYYSFVSNEGMNLSIKGNYASAIDSITKAYPYLNKGDENFANFYLGQSYYKKGEEGIGLEYFKKIDSALNEDNDLYPSLLTAYNYLINDSKKRKDQEMQLYYMNQLLKGDSIADTNYKYLSKNIYRQYDTPRYNEERNQLIKELQYKNANILQKNKWITTFSILFCVFMLIGFLNNYKLKKQYEKRYNDIIAKSKASVQEEISVKNAKPQAISLGIDSAIIDEVLQELDVFEKGEAYLTNQISLKDVAKIVNTNSKYLSKIVNTYKGKNFTTYINDLRIDYLVSHVQTDTKFQKYTIRAIAEEIGFSNPEGFSRAFQKKTGLKPSYFIKKVRETAVKKQ
jgi:AraC-like DNA-binding protein